MFYKKGKQTTPILCPGIKKKKECGAGVCFPAVPSRNVLSVRSNTSVAWEASRAENLLCFLPHRLHGSKSVPKAYSGKPCCSPPPQPLMSAQGAMVFNCTGSCFSIGHCSAPNSPPPPLGQSSGITFEIRSILLRSLYLTNEKKPFCTK